MRLTCRLAEKEFTTALGRLGAPLLFVNRLDLKKSPLFLRLQKRVHERRVGIEVGSSELFLC